MTTTETGPASDTSPETLVHLLTEAGRLEHCLLDAYLYTAASLKCTPQEFATLPDGRENRRRAVQFERARLWKQTILDITHEEMRHLHYVQTLLRSVGSRPAFSLPERCASGDGWVFRDWRAMIGDRPADGGDGVEVRLDGATEQTISRFVLYEASDALQDLDPFGPEATALMTRLADLELTLHLETALLHVDDDAERERLMDALSTVYRDLTPAEGVADAGLRQAAVEPEAVEPILFQSIGDLYDEQILPRFEQAFVEGWVRRTDRALVDEQQNPDFAAEGFLPVKETYRDKNFDKQADRNIAAPLIDFKTVDEIVAEIVEEGEGMGDFVAAARTLLATVERIGTRGYVRALYDDQYSKKPTPDWLAQGQLVRTSHLYRFAVILMGMREERRLCAESGARFDPVRSPLAAAGGPAVTELAEGLLSQLNSCYVVLVAWLSRMYEVKDWQADKPRRLSIEMLASWPLMSMAIRPMLELAALLPVDRTGLFRLEEAWLPEGGPARALLALWSAEPRSEDVNSAMDRLALETLTSAAGWAAGARAVAESLPGVDDNTRALLVNRLEELGLLTEFEKEFPYREAGGYSDRAPDLTYTQLHPGGDRFSENPAVPGPDGQARPLFDRSLLLRLRFAGWGLVQLATDPDPTFDEVGVSGTHMLHAADGDRRFDRAVLWQPGARAETSILRGPADALPAPGVRLVAADVCVAPGEATAGYLPLQEMSSTGAVQTSGLQQVVGTSGILEVQPVALAGEHVVDLLAQDGQAPFLNGLNHVVSQDGEALDPFVIEVRSDGGSALRRAVHSPGTSFLGMTPLQRLGTSRRPVGFDSPANVPAWARGVVPEAFRDRLGEDDFAMGWLAARAGALDGALAAGLDPTPGTRAQVDQVVSYAERLALVNLPKGTTVGWLAVTLHYGHTVSGDGTASTEAFTAGFSSATGLDLVAAPLDRAAVNGRWLASYTLGVMDTDSLRDLVYGELYVPLVPAGELGATVRLSRSWSAPDTVASAVQDGCRFDDPFWGDYVVHGQTRSTRLPDGTAITDTLSSSSPSGYGWTTTGLPGVDSVTSTLATTGGASGRVDLTLEVSYLPTTAEGAVAGAGMFAWIAASVPPGFAEGVALRPA